VLLRAVVPADQYQLVAWEWPQAAQGEPYRSWM
jgi:hypothetical protein